MASRYSQSVPHASELLSDVTVIRATSAHVMVRGSIRSTGMLERDLHVETMAARPRPCGWISIVAVIMKAQMGNYAGTGCLR